MKTFDQLSDTLCKVADLVNNLYFTVEMNICPIFCSLIHSLLLLFIVLYCRDVQLWHTVFSQTLTIVCVLSVYAFCSNALLCSFIHYCVLSDITVLTEGI